MPDPLATLSAIKDAKVDARVPLSQLTTWKVGGPAAFMVDVRTERSLKEVLAVVGELGLPMLVLGNGSNVLFSDGGFSGAVVRLSGELALVEVGALEVVSGAGAALGMLVAEAGRVGLSGLEFALGIPGTVGGAIMSNTGAYSGSCAAVLGSVETMTAEGEARTYEEFVDAYRAPLVPRAEVVTAATFVLVDAPVHEIKDRMDWIRIDRKQTQPWGKATAGSVFKNPPGESAGRLIDQCGLKGRPVGAARISEVHANFIVNEGGATAADIRALMSLAASEVKERFGVVLEPEVRMIGFEGEDDL